MEEENNQKEIIALWGKYFDVLDKLNQDDRDEFLFFMEHLRKPRISISDVADKFDVPSQVDNRTSTKEKFTKKLQQKMLGD